MADLALNRWLLLIHQIPPKPAYLRVKTWRRLQKLGAVQIKSSVYALPRGDQALEDFGWVAREVVEAGGDAFVCEARFVSGMTDDEVEALFHEAREADYRAIAEETRSLLGARRKKALGDDERATLEQGLARLGKRLGEVVGIDFFGVAARGEVEAALRAVEEHLEGADGRRKGSAPRLDPADYAGRTWVTRTGIHIDRIASAWLIRRFIDPRARFQFVSAKAPRPAAKKALRFDMLDGDFTHEGDRSTFEVLVERFGLDDPALVPIAEIVHDIDLKDAKFGRAEAAGIAQLVSGLAMANKDDEARLAQGSGIFENLYAYFRRKA